VRRQLPQQVIALTTDLRPRILEETCRTGLPKERVGLALSHSSAFSRYCSHRLRERFINTRPLRTRHVSSVMPVTRALIRSQSPPARPGCTSPAWAGWTLPPNICGSPNHLQSPGPLALLLCNSSSRQSWLSASVAFAEFRVVARQPEE
jgi:hypothetical protein